LTTVRKNNSSGVGNEVPSVAIHDRYFDYVFFSKDKDASVHGKDIIGGVGNADNPLQGCCGLLPDREGVGF
jgi:hypothetical protein